MPSDGLWGDGSAYFGHHGKKFDRWIVEDVPQLIRGTIPAATEGTALCIGGLSMGGYGALSLGARFSESFAAVSGHSSITRLEQMVDFVEEPLSEYTAYSEWPDVIDTIKAHRNRLPAIRFDCGTSDPLLEANQLLHQQLQEAGIPHVYEEFPGGHEWPYWQEQVERTFHFFNQAVFGSANS
jgi:S-formylglutathione hydrolase FrmB